MRVLAKAGIVAAEFIAALLVAVAAVAIHIAVTSGPDQQNSGGMSAFGDSLLFLAVFGIAAVPCMGTALYFLRPVRAFWLGLSVTASAVAATGLAACVAYIVGLAAGPDSAAQVWGVYSVLRLCVAPLFAIFFFVSAVFAPVRSSRIALGAATLLEGVSFAAALATLLLSR